MVPRYNKYEKAQLLIFRSNWAFTSESGTSSLDSSWLLLDTWPSSLDNSRLSLDTSKSLLETSLFVGHFSELVGGFAKLVGQLPGFVGDFLVCSEYLHVQLT